MASEGSVWNSERIFFFPKRYSDNQSNRYIEKLCYPVILSLDSCPARLKDLLNGKTISFHYDKTLYMYEGVCDFTAKLANDPENKLSQLAGEEGEPVASRIGKMVGGKQLLFRINDPMVGVGAIGGRKNYTFSLGISEASMDDLLHRHQEILNENSFFVKDVEFQVEMVGSEGVK